MRPIYDLSDLSESDLEWLSGKIRYEAEKLVEPLRRTAADALGSLIELQQKSELQRVAQRAAYTALVRHLVQRDAVDQLVLADELELVARTSEEPEWQQPLIEVAELLRLFELRKSGIH